MSNIPIRAGDTVLVRLKVVAADAGMLALECEGAESGTRCGIHRSDVAIVEHRDFQPGDRVTMHPKTDQHVWTIISVDDDWAWLRRNDGVSAIRMIRRVEDLRAAP